MVIGAGVEPGAAAVSERSPGQARVGSEFVEPSMAMVWPAICSWWTLFKLPAIWPLAKALKIAGPPKAARTTMIEMTTSISMSVNAERMFFFMGRTAGRVPDANAAGQEIIRPAERAETRNDLHRRLVASPGRLLENAGYRFRYMEAILRVLGPDATLRRGYSITMNERGEIIRTIAAVRPKMKIRTRVSDGEFGSEVLQ